MKILIAPDSFKGSLTSVEVSNIIKNAIQGVNNNHDITIKPMADGGEGTLEVLLTSLGGKEISVVCSGPLGEKIDTTYAILNSGVAVIEFARISGLTQVPFDLRNPDHTTSFGLGEVILDAIDQGCKSFILGLGGSATNDGGLGLLLALGMKAWDENNEGVGRFGIDVQKIRKISFDDLDPRLKDVDIKVAYDVDNLLCGESGASIVYGPQKGATKRQALEYDRVLSYFGDLIEADTGNIMKNIPGSGAAGGLGFALLSIGAKLVSGSKLIADSMDLREIIRDVDLIITGEGQSDQQTLSGKAPGYIAGLAKEYHVPVILISGILKDNSPELRSHFSGCFSIINRPLSTDESIAQAEELLYEQTVNLFQFMDSMLVKLNRSEHIEEK